MASIVDPTTSGDVVARITAIRDKWHFKQHPLSQRLAEGKLDLRVLAIYMAQHAKYVRYGLQAFGHLYARGPSDVRKMLAENMAEEPTNGLEREAPMRSIDSRFCALPPRKVNTP